MVGLFRLATKAGNAEGQAGISEARRYDRLASAHNKVTGTLGVFRLGD